MRFLSLILIFIFSTMLVASTVQASCDMQKAMDCHDCHDMHMESEDESSDEESPKSSCSNEFCCISMTFEKPFHNHTELKVVITSNSFQYLGQKPRDIVYHPFMPPILS